MILGHHFLKNIVKREAVNDIASNVRKVVAYQLTIYINQETLNFNNQYLVTEEIN